MVMLTQVFIIRRRRCIRDKADKLMYEYAKTSLINEKVRVYKGGSWRDAYC